MRIKFDLYCDGFINTITLENKMLLWRDLVLHGISKDYPRDIVYLIIHFLRRESIYQSALESRNYHIDRMPIVVRKSRITGFPKKGFYLDTQCNDDCEESVYIYGEILDDFTDKWDRINPRGLEYAYFDIWRWSRFEFPYMNFVYSFNRGRILLRFLKRYGWYDINSEDNIVDKLTDYEEI